jgi:hypothetical protein
VSAAELEMQLDLLRHALQIETATDAQKRQQAERDLQDILGSLGPDALINLRFALQNLNCRVATALGNRR